MAVTFPDLRGKRIVDFELKEKAWGQVFQDELPDLDYLTLLFEDGSTLTLRGTDHHPDNPSIIPEYVTRSDRKEKLDAALRGRGIDPGSANRLSYALTHPIVR